MLRGLAASVAALSAVAGGGVAAQTANETTCADGLRIIIARGTGEQGTVGTSAWIAQRVASQVKGSDYIGLDYPATFVDPDYDESEQAGALEMKETVMQYYQDCPRGKMAVVGYSQGAQLTTDAFCGGAGGVFSNISAIPSNIVKSSVVAVVLLGDPSHNPEATFNKGTSDEDGIFVRKSDTYSTCEAYADRIVSYCDTGDVYCDRGDDRRVHGSYIETYGDDIVEFIVKQFNAHKTPTVSPTPSSSSPPSGAPTESGSGSENPDSAAPGKASATGLLAMVGIAVLVSLL